jgi:hypothetical protein
MTINADVRIHQGEDVIIKVAVLDELGAVKDLAGATVVFRMGDIRAPSAAFAKAGALTTDGTDGLIQVTLTDIETAAFDVLTYDFQFIITDAAGAIQVVREGTMDVQYMIV